MYQAADKTRTSILRVDGVGDVLAEAPAKVATAILLFCQGLGLLTTLTQTERTVRSEISKFKLIPSVNFAQFLLFVMFSLGQHIPYL